MMKMIQSLLKWLSKQTKFIQKQNNELQRELPVNRYSTKPKTNNQSGNNKVLHNKDISFQKMVAADKIILKPESIIKKPRETTTKSSDSSTLAEKNNVATLGHSTIEYVNGYEI